MNFLGIDYGSKRIGLAIGNDSECLAMPLQTIENSNDALNNLRNILHNNKVAEIIVGVPISFDGKEHAQAKEARAFGESLKELGLPVHFVNEILTSKQSRDSGSTNIDASSAALILQSFLDRKLNN